MRFVEVMLDVIVILTIFTQILLPIFFPSLPLFWALKKGKFWFWQTKKIREAAKSKSLDEKIDAAADEIKTARNKISKINNEVEENLEKDRAHKKKLRDLK